MAAARLGQAAVSSQSTAERAQRCDPGLAAVTLGVYCVGEVCNTFPLLDRRCLIRHRLEASGTATEMEAGCFTRFCSDTCAASRLQHQCPPLLRALAAQAISTARVSCHDAALRQPVWPQQLSRCAAVRRDEADGQR